MKTKPITERKVSRVLVMLQYEADSTNDIFDLTGLVRELAPRGEHQHACIHLSVTASKDYASADWPRTLKTEANWRASINFSTSAESGFLEDAINSSLPDSFATQDLKKKLQRLTNKADELRRDISAQRLLDAAAIRHQHPIARVTEAPALSAVAGEPALSPVAPAP